ncbi:uncharacterized protein LOC127879713 [Dreissena polymorpha]|uniref:Calmodulin n=1 Tax=Dreissena polymorpha TaxID=45954 RepID=A0A9D4KLI7_DREPO|nr:uncharacterized protein LOC127879713 [Dreissena polymorpha]KAH3841851.1 hypothetical protein DPMN_115332 [Dreissena polymorpha]
MLTDEQKKYATSAFESLVKKRTGSLPSNKETLTSAVRLAGLNPTDHEIDQLMTVSDLSDAGLTKEEFLSLLARLEWRSPEEARRTLHQDFTMFIDNNAQTIADEEFVAILTREGGEKLTVDEANRIVSRFERDAQGDLDLKDLIEQLLAVTPR